MEAHTEGIQAHGATTRISSRYPGNLFPTKQEDILRTLRFEPGFEIDGSVYCHELTASGQGVVTGPVLVRGDITLENRDGAGPQKFLSGLFSRSNILSRSEPRRVSESPASDITRMEFLIRGDVAAERVSLSNAVVLGNVRGTVVQVSNCMVLGGIVADEEAIITNSCFLTFESRRVRLLGRNSCLVPHGAASEGISWEDYTGPDGESLPPELRYAAVCRTGYCECAEGAGDLTCRAYMTGACSSQGVRLTPRDHFQVLDPDGERRSVLNVGGRVLNLEPVAEQIQEITAFIRESLMYEHYDDTSQAERRAAWRTCYSPEQSWLLEQMADAADQCRRSNPQNVEGSAA